MTHPIDGMWRVYGLDVRSPWPLSATRSSATEPHLTLTLHEPSAPPATLPGRLLGEDRTGGHVREAAYEHAGEVSLLYPRLLVATFDAARQVCHLHPAADAPPEVVQRLASVAAVATWMVLTDRPMLHASAVQVGGTGVLLVGGSGSGKSTVAAALVGASALAISDDVCRLSEVDGAWVCFPDAGQLRLRPGSAALAALFPAEAVVRTEDRVVVTVPTVDRAVPVGAVLLPHLSPTASEITATRVRGARSLMAVIEHPRMASLHGPEHSAALFRFASSLVDAVPVWDVTLPKVAVTPSLGADLHRVVTQLLGAA